MASEKKAVKVSENIAGRAVSEHVLDSEGRFARGKGGNARLQSYLDCNRGSTENHL